MNLAKLKAVIEADASRYHAALKSVDAKTERVFGGVRARIQRLKKDFREELGKGLSIGFGTAVATKGLELVGRGVQAVGDFIGMAIQTASDLNETMSKSKVVFGDAADGIRAWGETAADAFGLSKQKAIEAAASLGNVFVGLDLGQNKAAEMSKRLVLLAADLASFNNLSGGTGEALEKLQSGLAGESEPMRSLGIFLSEAKVKAKAMQMGLGGAHDELTEGQKILARYQVILDSTATAQGDFARTSDDLANSQRRADAALENRHAELGQRFLPIQKLITDLQINFLKGLGVAADAIAATGKALTSFIDMLTPWDSATEQATHAFTGRVGKMADDLSTLSGKARDDLGAVVRSVDKVASASGTMRSAVVIDNAAAAAAFSALRSSMIADINSLIDQAYDPLILRDQLLATQREMNAAEAVRNSLKSTAAQKRDAVDLIVELRKSVLEQRTKLFEMGALSTKEQAALVGDLRKTIDLSSGPMKIALQGVLDKIREIEKAGKFVPIRFVTSGVGLAGADRGKAIGGPVAANSPYIVGERGPEWFIPKVSGTILPNGTAPEGMSGSASSGGEAQGDIINNIYNPEPRAADQDIGRMMRRLEGIGLVGRRRRTGAFGS